MSMTGEAADVHGPGQPHASNAAVLNPSLLDLPRCANCNPEEEKSSSCSPEEEKSSTVYCMSCKAALCELCDTSAVHNSRVTRKHARMPIEEYLMVERGLGHSTPTEDQMTADDENKFCFFSPMDNLIRLQPRLASLVKDPTVRPSLVAFVGPTGVGKSTLMRLLLSLGGQRDASDMPLSGAPNDAHSTSADLHMYYGGQVLTNSPTQSALDSNYPLLYVDSEGRGGSQAPRAFQNIWKACRNCFHERVASYEEVEEKRFKHVQVSYPRMLYIFSDVLCFVFSGDWREHESIVKPLLDWGRSATVGAANQHRPQLILIINKTGSEAAELQFNDFRETYKLWIQGDNTRSHDELQRYYSDPLICLIPLKEINAKTLMNRVKELHSMIHASTKCIRRTRHGANQLFTRRQLQLYLQLAADTFSKNPDEDFDIYKASMALRPTSTGPGGYIFEFHQAVMQANLGRSNNSERHLISLRVLQSRIAWSMLLRICRIWPHHPVGANAHLPNDLREALERAQTLISNDQPCAANLRGIPCDTLRSKHFNGQHAFGSTRWEGDFIPYPEPQLVADAGSLVNLAESTLQSVSRLDVKEIRTNLLEVRQAERSEHVWMESFTSYRVCVSCMGELPTEVLSCGHIICAMCAKEEVKTDFQLTCPVCLSSAKWYPKDLPSLAGYRILSLDGGGVRGIVQLLSLEKIMSFFPDMHVEDLFDIIVGTSTGGVIALALTVRRAVNEQPKRLPEVIRLFQDLCRQVFHRGMLRWFAGNPVTLRFFQLLRIYDTKYKNDNLLKLLKEHFGEQPLLQSCVGGPHVIITSCDRDNGDAGAWFTSYNRWMPENECSDVPTEAVEVEKVQRTSKLNFGRVFDNHLFSAKDVGAATTAAPTYFPSYEAGNRFWRDGGLRYNCPAQVAIQEARTLWPKHSASALISLGSDNLKNDRNLKSSDSLVHVAKGMRDIATDSESGWQAALALLKSSRAGSIGCSLRLNPTITVPFGESCELDRADKLSFLSEATEEYLSKDGLADVEKAANLLFAALFYIDVNDSPKEDLPLSIRSRAALPRCLQSALNDASSSATPPFSVTLCDAPGVESKISWTDMKWDQNFMYLPFKFYSIPWPKKSVDVESGAFTGISGYAIAVAWLVLGLLLLLLVCCCKVCLSKKRTRSKQPRSRAHYWAACVVVFLLSAVAVGCTVVLFVACKKFTAQAYTVKDVLVEAAQNATTDIYSVRDTLAPVKGIVLPYNPELYASLTSTETKLNSLALVVNDKVFVNKKLYQKIFKIIVIVFLVVTSLNLLLVVLGFASTFLQWRRFFYLIIVLTWIFIALKGLNWVMYQCSLLVKPFVCNGTQSACLRIYPFYVNQSTYNEIYAMTSASQSTLDALPLMEGLTNCSLVTNPINTMVHQRCGPAKVVIDRIWIAIAVLSSIMILLLAFWCLARRRHVEPSHNITSITPQDSQPSTPAFSAPTFLK